MIRKAKIKEALSIRDLINSFAKEDIILPLSLSEIYERLRDFFVFIDDREGVIGTCALHIIWDDLAEIRSLAVTKGHWKKGIGNRLVSKCLTEAKDLGIKRVFCLTYSKGFFSHLGFKEIDKSLLPHKIWADCIKCTKFPDCNEIAMVCEL